MAKYSLSEKTVIKKSVSDVFQYVLDFHNWTAWSPWLCIEKDAKVEISENSNKPGAVYSWEGKLVGSGRTDLVSQIADEVIHYELTFLKPFKSKADVRFEFREVEEGCEVEWHMESSLPFFLFWLKKQMIAMLKMDFARGLMIMKDLLETGKLNASTELEGVVYYDLKNLVGLKAECNLANIGESMDKAFGELMKEVKKQNLQTVGSHLALYTKYDIVSKDCVYYACVQMNDVKNVDETKLDVLSYHFDDYVKVKHKGEYKFLGNSWAAAMSFMRFKKFKPFKGIVGIEVYNNMKGEVADADLDTDVVIPLI